MLSETLNNALGDQIRREFHSAYVYLGMAAHFEDDALPGCAHWMREQAREEVVHAMRLFEFVIDRGGRVSLQAIDAPPAEFGTPLATFTAALEHEQYITRSINELYALAQGEHDYAVQSHLQWFIDEQVEEEKTAQEIVDLLGRAGDDPTILLMLDQRLGDRKPEAGE